VDHGAYGDYAPVILTGSNSGLGFAAARKLAIAGNSVVLAVRDAERGAEAARRILESAPDASVRVLPLDLASLTSVREFAATFAGDIGSWGALVNNAGVKLHPKRELTADGFELTLGTNHLGHFALTGLLLPFAGLGARVISVTSISYRWGHLHFHDLRWDHGYSPMRAYAASKLANLLFARELQRKAEREQLDLISVAVHPGYSVTPGKGLDGALVRTRLVQSFEDGSLPTVFGVVNPALAGGELVGPGNFLQTAGSPHVVHAPRIRDEMHLARRLWRLSGQLTRVNW
jgi:NAD(P)-dependent dehydrogenase (short-subunit alcohol dehydrogenase family)